MIQRADFQLSEVLKIYRQISNNGTRQSYIEIYPVKRSKDELRLGEGRPLSMDSLKKIINYISIKNEGYVSTFEQSLLDPKILAFESDRNHRFIVWYSPAGPRDVFFSASCGLKDGKYNMPAILYVVQDGHLYLFSMTTGKKRPTLDTKLYHAPVLNLIGKDSFCWGSVRVNDPPYQIDKEIQFWMTNVWDTRFSHAGSSVSTKSDLIKVYKKIVDKPFPLDQLIYTRSTLKTIINKLKREETLS